MSRVHKWVIYSYQRNVWMTYLENGFCVRGEKITLGKMVWIDENLLWCLWTYKRRTCLLKPTNTLLFSYFSRFIYFHIYRYYHYCYFIFKEKRKEKYFNSFRTTENHPKVIKKVVENSSTQWKYTLVPLTILIVQFCERFYQKILHFHYRYIYLFML